MHGRRAAMTALCLYIVPDLSNRLTYHDEPPRMLDREHCWSPQLPSTRSFPEPHFLVGWSGGVVAAAVALTIYSW